MYQTHLGPCLMSCNALLRHPSSDEVLPNFCLFCFGEDPGMGAASSAPSPEVSGFASEASTGTT
jgi:hypothetical protein